jgi:hypothetical protein
MRDITSSNTHHNGAKGGGGYGPHGPKVWWVVVACETRRKERSETWLDRVCHKNKNNDKNSDKNNEQKQRQKWSLLGSTLDTSGKAPRAGLWITARSRFALAFGYGV